MEESAIAVGRSTPAPMGAGHACKHDPAFHLAPTGKPPCKCQKLIWPRRIHALSGALFTGFLLVHLAIAATAFRPELYQRAVDRAEKLVAAAPGAVLGAIFVPFLVQAALGIYLLAHHGLRYNVKKCNRGGKLRFFLQRVSGIAILAFFLFHVGTLHPWGLHQAYRATYAAGLSAYAAGGLFQPQEAFASTVRGMAQLSGSAAGNAAVLVATLLAVLLTAFHAANGAWTGGLVWKIQGTRIHNGRWAGVCWLVGLALALPGAASLYTLGCASAAQAVLNR